MEIYHYEKWGAGFAGRSAGLRPRKGLEGCVRPKGSGAATMRQTLWV
jgi:hypothetical protein